MADRKHLLHVRSNVSGKLPTTEQLEYGELAINYADGEEKISLKSSTDNIRTISTDEQNNEKFATKVETSNAIQYETYMNTISTVDTLTKVPIDKFLVIATITSTTASLTLNEKLKQNQELHIIVYNNSQENQLNVTIPSSGDYVNLSESVLMILPSSYGEINIISDGTKMYIRTL